MTDTPERDPTRTEDVEETMADAEFREHLDEVCR